MDTKTTDRSENPSVGPDAVFGTLYAAESALRDIQYAFRDISLPSYPEGGTCGCANLGNAISHIVAARAAIRDLEKQLAQWNEQTKHEY